MTTSQSPRGAYDNGLYVIRTSVPNQQMDCRDGTQLQGPRPCARRGVHNFRTLLHELSTIVRNSC